MTKSQRYLRGYWMTLTAAACLYVLTSGSTLLMARSGAHTEVFPIFSWDLFSVVPNETEDFGLRILALDGVALARPTFVEALEDQGTSFSVSTHMAIQELGQAVRVGDRVRQRRLEGLLRGSYLGGMQRPVRYELVRRRYDVLSRYRDGRYLKLTVIGLQDMP